MSQPVSVTLVPGIIWQNLGDLGIFQATLRSIRARMGAAARIRVVSIFPAQGPRTIDLGDGIEIVAYPITLPIRGIAGHAQAGLRALALPILARIHRRKPAWSARIAPWAAPTLDALAGADLVIATGGNYLIDHGRGIPAFLLPAHLISLATALRRPIAFWGHTIGPFRRRFLARNAMRLLRRATVLTVRDASSLEELPADVRARAVVTADEAFLLEPAPLRDGLRDLVGRPTLAVTALPWRFSTSDDPSGARERYYRALSEALDLIVERRDLDVLFIPHQAGWERENDGDAIQAILGRSGARGRMRVAPIDLTPPEAIALLKSCEALVGTRMHSVIFAIAAGTPVVGIGYVPKTRAMLDMLGLADLALDAEDVRTEELVRAIEALLDDPRARERVRMARDEARARAMRNGELVLGAA